MIKSIADGYAAGLGYYSWKHLVSYHIINGDTKHLKHIIFKVNNIVEAVNHDKNLVDKKAVLYNSYN